MVCISCIVIPVVLFLWHKYLQPIFLKIWNPWGKVEDKSDGKQQTEVSNGTTSALKCPFSSSSKTSEEVATPPTDHPKAD